MFYSSAAYSAFFKDFTPDDTKITQAIFDSQAIGKALADGITELIFILAIPAVFYSLNVIEAFLLVLVPLSPSPLYIDIILAFGLSIDESPNTYTTLEFSTLTPISFVDTEFSVNPVAKL